MALIFLWYRNWYREPWIFTGIGTEYWNFGTVTTLIYSVERSTKIIIKIIIIIKSPQMFSYSMYWIQKWKTIYQGVSIYLFEYII